MKKICIMLMLVLLAGCATTAKYQSSVAQWQGQNIQSLINAWGYADSAIKLPSGNMVYMYYRHQIYSKPGYPIAGPTFVNMNGPVATPTYNNIPVTNESITMYCQTWFETNPSGIIINTRFAGNNCVSNSAYNKTP